MGAPSFASGFGAKGGNDALTFTLSGLSKIAGLPQMKVAWIAVSGPEELKREALNRLEVIADTYLSMNAPMQWAIPAMLEERVGIQRQLMARIRANLGRPRPPARRAKTLYPSRGGRWLVRHIAGPGYRFRRGACDCPAAPDRSSRPARAFLRFRQGWLSCSEPDHPGRAFPRRRRAAPAISCRSAIARKCPPSICKIASSPGHSRNRRARLAFIMRWSCLSIRSSYLFTTKKRT